MDTDKGKLPGHWKEAIQQHNYRADEWSCPTNIQGSPNQIPTPFMLWNARSVHGNTAVPNDKPLPD